MNITELLKSEIEDHYAAAEGLFRMVDADKLDWKPATGENWMTTGQLLKHITGSCGTLCRSFVTGKWEAPAEGDAKTANPDEALKLLAEDKTIALAAIDEAGEDALQTRMVPVPWDPSGKEQALGKMVQTMIWHLAQHKGQLFYYLKLQGKPVHTGNLYG